MAPDLNESIMRGIGSKRCLSRYAQCDSMQPRTTAIVKGSKRRAVAIGATPEQLYGLITAHGCNVQGAFSHVGAYRVRIHLIRPSLLNGSTSNRPRAGF